MSDYCAQEMMNSMLGSSERAVTTADGFWQIPGFHSPNGSAVVVNYMNGALLAYGHACMRGTDPYELERVCDCELRCDPFDLQCEGKQVIKGNFAGTSKMMESSILYECFADLFDDEIHIEKVSVGWRPHHMRGMGSHVGCGVPRCMGPSVRGVRGMCGPAVRGSLGACSPSVGSLCTGGPSARGVPRCVGSLGAWGPSARGVPRCVGPLGVWGPVRWVLGGV